MECPYCKSNEFVIWSRKKSQFRCKKCSRVFTPKSNPNRGIIKDNKRYCFRCEEWKDISEFGEKSMNNKKIIRSRCKECNNLSNKEYDEQEGG